MNNVNINMVYYINDAFAGYLNVSIEIMYIISILSAISVITIKNPIFSVLFLIGLFITIGSYLITIGIGFIGLSYLLVYVGAVSILFLFILMLINIRVSELINETKNSIPLIFAITLIFSNVSYIFLPEEHLSSNVLSTALNNWECCLTELSHITSIGNIMYSVFAIWLILVSIILLLAMVGAIVINIKKL